MYIYITLCVCFAINELDRTKFVQWCKKYAKMEEIVIEFELKMEEKPEFKTFYDEVQEKLDSMSSFKKTFQKFQHTVETCLKKVAVLHMHVEHTS